MVEMIKNYVFLIDYDTTKGVSMKTTAERLFRKLLDIE